MEVSIADRKTKMKIVCEKGHDARKMMKILMDFIEEETLGYPTLKEDMKIEITLKNNINQINPNNEREFYFGQKELDKKEEEEEEESELDYYLKEHWEMFILQNIGSLMKEIETDRSYISTAEKNGRSPENIERRKKALANKEKRLIEEKERQLQLHPFAEMVKNEQVRYRYTETEYDGKIKIMEFDINGKSYTFEYAKYVWGDEYICGDDGELVFR